MKLLLTDYVKIKLSESGIEYYNFVMDDDRAFEKYSLDGNISIRIDMLFEMFGGFTDTEKMILEIITGQ